MLELRRRIFGLDVRHRVRAALVADEQRIAVREVARARGLAVRGHQPAVGVLRTPGGNTLRDDPARRVLAEMDHLGAGIDLLHAVRHRDRVELATGIVATQDAGRVLPGDRRAGLDLGPRDLRVGAAAVAALGDEVVDAALALVVSGVPVLDRRVLDLGVVERDELDHGGMELVVVALRGGAALEIRDVRALVGDDQRALELPRVALVDAEIGRQLHRAAHARRDIDERAVGEDGGVQGREEVVGHGHDRAEILPHEVRVFADGLGDRHEDHAGLRQLSLERGGHRDRVEHRVDGDPTLGGDALQHFDLAQGNSELLVGLQDLGVDLVEGHRRRALGRRIVVDVLVIDLVIRDPRPFGLLHGLPALVSVEAPGQHPFGLVLLGRDEADHVLGDALGGLLHLDRGLEPVLVLVEVDRADPVDGFLHCRHCTSPDLHRRQGPGVFARGWLGWAALQAACPRR